MHLAGEDGWELHPEAARHVGRLGRDVAYHEVLAVVRRRLDPEEWRPLTAQDVAAILDRSYGAAGSGLRQLEADRVILGRGHGGVKARRLSRTTFVCRVPGAWASLPPDPPLAGLVGRPVAVGGVEPAPRPGTHRRRRRRRNLAD